MTVSRVDFGELSRAAAELDEKPAEFRDRRLGHMPGHSGGRQL